MTGTTAVYVALLVVVAGGLGIIIGVIGAGARSESADQVTTLLRQHDTEAAACAAAGGAGALLAYGYDLGGGPAGWKIQETGPHGTPEPSWYSNPPGTDEAFIDAADARLMDSARADVPEPEDWTRERLGVTLTRYGSHACPRYLLAALAITIPAGTSTRTIDFPAMREMAFLRNWDAKLADALETLQITPHQQQPQWLLCATSHQPPPHPLIRRP